MGPPLLLSSSQLLIFSVPFLLSSSSPLLLSQVHHLRQDLQHTDASNRVHGRMEVGTPSTRFTSLHSFTAPCTLSAPQYYLKECVHLLTPLTPPHTPSHPSPGHPPRAPTDCTQYFTGVAGTIYTYNFGQVHYGGGGGESHTSTPLTVSRCWEGCTTTTASEQR